MKSNFVFQNCESNLRVCRVGKKEEETLVGLEYLVVFAETRPMDFTSNGFQPTSDGFQILF